MRRKRTSDELIAMTESQLVIETWAIVDAIAGRHSDCAGDDHDDLVAQLDGLLNEAVERWAPAAAWEEQVKRAFELHGGNSDSAWAELDDTRAGIQQRAGARIIRAAFENGPHLVVIEGGGEG